MGSRTRSGKTFTAVQPSNHEDTEFLIACIGVLVAYAPFGWWIADAYPTFAVMGGILALAVASAPDKLSWRTISERWSHSLLGAITVGSLLAAAGWWIADGIVVYAGSRAVTPTAAAQYGFVVGGLAAYGHVLADGLTATDIQPLWPVSEREGSINLPALVDPRNNDGVNLAGTLAVVVVFVAILSSTVTVTVLTG